VRRKRPEIAAREPSRPLTESRARLMGASVQGSGSVWLHTHACMFSGCVT
jgi:hypothetical protein